MAARPFADINGGPVVVGCGVVDSGVMQVILIG